MGLTLFPASASPQFLQEGNFHDKVKFGVVTAQYNLKSPITGAAVIYFCS